MTYDPDEPPPNFRPIAIAVLIIAVVAIAGWFVYHQWWVDTHCTMVLGTQVCQ